MTRDQWEGAGVNDQDSLYWNAANGWTIAASQVSEAAMPYIMADDLFVVMCEDPDGEVERTLPIPPNALTHVAPGGERLSGDGVEQYYEVPMGQHPDQLKEPAQDPGTGPVGNVAGDVPDADDNVSTANAGGSGAGLGGGSKGT